MTIFEDYHAFIEENESLLKFIFKHSANIRSWIEPAMYVVDQGKNNDEIDDETIDFACKYIMDKIDIIKFLDESLFKKDYELISANEKNITCLFHISDIFLESYRVENDQFEERIQELEDEIFTYIEANTTFDSEFQLKIEAVMQQFLVSSDEEYLELTNELLFEMANGLGYSEPSIDDELDGLIN